MHTRNSFLAAAVAVLSSAVTGLNAQITIDPYTSAMDLATALIQIPSITINSATYTGAPVASGFFGGGNSGGLSFNTGIVLTSGAASNVIGPNNSGSRTTNNGLGATPNIADGLDGTTLNIVFTPTADVISFQYVFGSEEYNEWVGSSFNDAFRFVLNGTNIARIPGSSAVVEINSVNNSSNSSYYFDNTGGAKNTQLDGLVGTNSGFRLFATGTVNPGVENTISIEIADRGDRSYDSAVFLAGGSFTDAPPPLPVGAVPEPSTYGLLGALALVGLIALRRRRR